MGDAFLIQNIKEPEANDIEATGGNIIDTYTISGQSYKVHIFTTVGNSNFNITKTSNKSENFNQLEFLVIGGGAAGGGRYMGGGGGAGGYLSSVEGELSGRNSAALPKVLAQVNNYSVVVGAGGVGKGEDQSSNPGAPSSALGYTALGGGGAGSWFNNRNALSGGGSGGGHSGYQRTFLPSNGTAGQGFRGGRGDEYGAGGGGGAGAVGNNGSPSQGGTGGIGRQSIITGTLIYRAGGGGGGDYTGTGTNPGGLGGGGFGANGPNNSSGGNPGPGSANTGGGGGGANGYNNSTAGRTGGNGGSGFVAIRYKVGG